MKKPRQIDLILYFLKLGCIGFGGSIALAHTMHKNLVEEKQWLTEEEYLRGLTLSQLAPGPLAAQLVIYIGFIRTGVVGATLTGIAFVLPSFLLVVLLAMLYIQFGSLPFINSAFYGIGAAVIGIITTSAIRLTKKTLKPKKLLLTIFICMFFLVAFYRQTSVMFFILSGILTMLFYSKRKIKFTRTFAFTLFNPSSFLPPIIFPQMEKLFIFFQLDLGGHLKKYRQAFIDQLDKMDPAEAERIWGIVNAQIREGERDNKIPEKLEPQFPDTFEKAKAYYKPSHKS